MVRLIKDVLVEIWEDIRRYPQHLTPDAGPGSGGYLAKELPQVDAIVRKLKDGSAYMTEWLREGQLPHTAGEWDIWAKRWRYVDDTFEWRRFTNRKIKPHNRMDTKWQTWGLEEGWVPVYFVPSPTAPVGDHKA